MPEIIPIPGSPASRDQIAGGHGERAMTGASLLEGAGRKDLAELHEGIHAWERQRRPVEIGG